MNIAQPVNSKIDGVSFTFYEPSEVRRMSVKQVVNPVLLDSLGNPTKGGLYDPAMGPFTKHHLCGTCSLSYFNCPGHFGHIELPSPVVNPMMFDTLYRFLQGCCPYCHKFSFNRVTATRFAAKLRLLEYGLIQEANDLDDLLPHTGKSAADDEDGEGMALDESDDESPRSKKNDESSDEYIERIKEYVDDKLTNCEKATYKVTMVNNVRRAIIKELIMRSRNQTCQNCRGPLPKLRRDGYLKVFREPLTRKQQASKQAKGMEYRDVLHLDVAAIEKELKNGQKAAARKQAANGSKKSSDDDMDVDSEAESASEDETDVEDAYDSVDAYPKKQANAPQKSSVFMTPIHLRNHLRLLFSNEPELARLLFQQRDPRVANALDVTSDVRSKITLTLPSDVRSPAELADMFFIEALPVPPTKFRPASVMNDEVMENPQNVYLGAVLKTCVFLRNLVNPDAGDSSATRQNSEQIAQAAEGGINFERVINTWVQLQQSVNNVMDSSKNPTLGKNGKAPDPGIRQVLEKKEGLFRQNMMGKRVNYAARSVISPDPNLESDEVGVPPVFAKKLTFPEPVTAHNVKEMRKLVINGPETWPGAVSVQHEDGSLVYLDRLSHESRVALANQLLTPQDTSSKPTALGNMFTTRTTGVNKKVYRHLRNGDMVVMNRQPTLHRASMAGMRAHVLPGERTLRFHYMNCNQFNSDFDGDEMNMHFPQSEAARSELRNIMGADMTYLNPTDGGPLRGLIQDSVDGGVILTKRDTLLTRSEYQELVYWALRPETQPHLPDGKVQLLPPAIFKPRPMWTGKQVISTLVLNLTWGYSPLNLVSKDKIGKRYWGPNAEEEERVLILDGELLVGVLDKSQFGASSYGLVHSIYELYSPTHAGRLLSTLGRLFLRYLQEIGFSCRMEDLLFDKQGDSVRKDMVKHQRAGGIEAALGFVGLKDYNAEQLDSDRNVQHEFHRRMEEVLRHDDKLAQLDGTIMASMNKLTGDLIAECLPSHLHLPFPHNNMVVMTVSGAKGSNINLSQITCCLGQQSLEGRRVPLMVSGKSLPSFAAFDSAGRAGGYVASRFLTGLKPQEFYFHCMAGREGLIDTAVKTSRSGYLQRCLIKHLEGIQVHYDYTVRDSDGSVIQFQYGEDALDVLKSQHLTKFDFAAANYRALRDKFNPASAAGVLDDELARKYAKKIIGKPGSYTPSDILAEPVSSRFNPSRYLGAVSERFYVELEKYLQDNPNGLLQEKKSKKKQDKDEHVNQAESLTGRKDKMLASVSDTGALMAAVNSDCSPRNFRMLQYLNYLHSLIDPGECVGLIAAQGIGEPSTQMTLNTFHLAGFGAKNVTMGIPRLREIVMVASDNIAAPTMDIPLLDGVQKSHAESISSALTKLTLGDVTDYLEVKERLTAKKDAVDHKRYRQFTVRLQLFPSKEYEEEHDVTQEDINFAIEMHFVYKLEMLIAKDLKRTYRLVLSDDVADQDEVPVPTSSGSSSKPADEEGDEAKDNDLVDESDIDSDSDDDANGDGDADDARAASRRAEHTSYDGPDDEDKEMLDSMDAELEQLDDMAKQEASGKKGKGAKAAAAGEDGEDMDVDDGSDDESDEEELRAKVISLAKRRRRMIKRYPHVVGYNFVDSKDETYAEIEMQFPATTPKFLMLNLAEEAVRSTVVREIPGIASCYVNTPKSESDTALVIGSNGANIRGIWDASLIPLEDIAGLDERTGLDQWVDVNHLYTNDIAAILRTYGVEAARSAIMREISGVFGAYDIGVDKRHLSLVADYMTFEGGFKPFNRIGLSSSPSPFAKMSFESTCTFLQEATVSGDFDNLHNPSARIVMGQPVASGTGAFDVLVDLATPAKA
ncbi:beta and beta-prime subunits of DNA dependent RNA-polymerase [Martensiomyces pterosporus]|nr:beta and beta-prime subunits of DNA dependent RNA-polymerase [Martensiomyces pterosporus]